MGSYQMAILLHLTDQLLIARNIFPQKEKRGLHIPLSQAVQQLLRADRVGAVVKGESQKPILSARLLSSPSCSSPVPSPPLQSPVSCLRDRKG